MKVRLQRFRAVGAFLVVLLSLGASVMLGSISLAMYRRLKHWIDTEARANRSNGHVVRDACSHAPADPLKYRYGVGAH